MGNIIDQYQGCIRNGDEIRILLILWRGDAYSRMRFNNNLTHAIGVIYFLPLCSPTLIQKIHACLVTDVPMIRIATTFRGLDCIMNDVIDWASSGDRSKDYSKSGGVGELHYVCLGSGMKLSVVLMMMRKRGKMVRDERRVEVEMWI